MTQADRVSAFDRFMEGKVTDEFRCWLICKDFFYRPGKYQISRSLRGRIVRP